MFPNRSLLILLPCLLLLPLTTPTNCSFSVYSIPANQAYRRGNNRSSPSPSPLISNTANSSGQLRNTTPSSPPALQLPLQLAPSPSSGSPSISNTANSSFPPPIITPPSSPSQSPLLAPPSPSTGPDPKKKTSRLVLIIIIVSVVFVLNIALCLYMLRRKSFKLTVCCATASGVVADKLVSDYNIRIFKVYKSDALKAATNCFSDENKLGQGGFGPVYKGVLHGEPIAVKKLSTKYLDKEHGERAIRSEIESLARAKHRNLVELLGYASDANEQLLVYEYLEKRSLDIYLFDSVNRRLLPWQTRYNIIDGVARGLAYIHLSLSTPIIHRDLKASNVLLDGKMNPKISDFGLARILGDDQTHAYTCYNAGTRGYMAPEYLSYNRYSAKSDVFSFGILILEIVSGKKNRSRFLDLPSYAKKVSNEGTLLQFIDEDLNKNYNEQQALKCVKIGLLCIEDNPADRPTMKEVQFMLDME